MKKVLIELEPAEVQVLVQALDSHVRAQGLNVAGNVAVLLQKLQAALKVAAAEDEGEGGGKE